MNTPVLSNAACHVLVVATLALACVTRVYLKSSDVWSEFETHGSLHIHSNCSQAGCAASSFDAHLAALGPGEVVVSNSIALTPPGLQ